MEKDKKTKCIILTEELAKGLKEVANKKAITQNAIIRLALIEYIERNK